MMMNLLIKSIERYAPRTTSASWLVRPAMLRARKAATAPSQPTENATCAVMVNLRTVGVMVVFSFPVFLSMVGAHQQSVGRTSCEREAVLRDGRLSRCSESGTRQWQ